MTRTPCRDQRGTALSAFVAVIVVALFAVVGLVVDGGAQSAARARAFSGAAAAARSAVDAGAGARALGNAPDLAVMADQGRRVLADRGLEGDVVIEAGVVHVTARTTAKTTFLSLIGISTLAASGEAAAALTTG